MDGVGFGVHPTASEAGSQSAAFPVDPRTPCFSTLFELQVQFYCRSKENRQAVAVASFVRIEESLVRRMIPILCFHSCARNFAKNKPISNKPQVVRALLVQGCSVRGSHVHPSPKELELFRIANLDPPR